MVLVFIKQEVMMKKKIFTFILIFVLSSLYCEIVNTPNAKENLQPAQERLNTGSLLDTRDNPADPNRGTPFEAKELTIAAFDYFQKHGQEAAFAKFLDNDSQFFYKDLYIFVIDMDGKMLVHGKDKSLINRNLYDLKDSKGSYFIQKFIRIMQNYDSGWTDYFWRNYNTQEIESKLTFLKKIDENRFLGCGAYNNRK